MDSKFSIKSVDELTMATIQSSIVAGDSLAVSELSSINGDSLGGNLIVDDSLPPSVNEETVGEEIEVDRNIFGEILLTRPRGFRPLSVFNDPWWSLSKDLDAIYLKNGCPHMVQSVADKAKSHKAYLLMLGLHVPAVQRMLKSQVNVFFLCL